MKTDNERSYRGGLRNLFGSWSCTRFAAPSLDENVTIQLIAVTRWSNFAAEYVEMDISPQCTMWCRCVTHDPPDLAKSAAACRVDKAYPWYGLAWPRRLYRGFFTCHFFRSPYRRSRGGWSGQGALGLASHHLDFVHIRGVLPVPHRVDLSIECWHNPNNSDIACSPFNT